MAQTLEDLFSNSGPFNETEVVQALAPFITIHKDTNEVYLKGDGEISIDKKIIIYCLAKKMLAAKKYIDTEAVSALEIHKKLGIKKGSVDSNFAKLRDDGLLIGSNKNYMIPNQQVKKIINTLQINK